MQKGPIGVFDSGYGGLTVLKSLVGKLPDYDFLYLGDNARTPYGPRSYETIYQYTLASVKYLFDLGCPIVILACNTASAKALRTIQQNDLPGMDPQKRVLGVIRPTTEIIGDLTNTGHVGILGTQGTIQSESYLIEIKKFFPEVIISQEVCPMWVPLVENGEHESKGADFFIEKHIRQIISIDDNIDTLLLACTHYPLLIPKIRHFLPDKIRIIDQGEIVANSLVNYLKRHLEINDRLIKNSKLEFLTTDDANAFIQNGTMFYGEPVTAKKIHLN